MTEGYPSHILRTTSPSEQAKSMSYSYSLEPFLYLGCVSEYYWVKGLFKSKRCTRSYSANWEPYFRSPSWQAPKSRVTFSVEKNWLTVEQTDCLILYRRVSCKNPRHSAHFGMPNYSILVSNFSVATAADLLQAKYQNTWNIIDPHFEPYQIKSFEAGSSNIKSLNESQAVLESWRVAASCTNTEAG